MVDSDRMYNLFLLVNWNERILQKKKDGLEHYTLSVSMKIRRLRESYEEVVVWLMDPEINEKKK